MRLILPILLLAVLLIAATVWQPGRTQADLRAGYTALETLDPQLARAAEDVRIAYALFQGLCTFDPGDFSIQGGVAESWDISDNRLTYTFHLRPDARWSDGSPVTAHDFRFAWKLGMMPDTAPPYIAFLFLIEGGREYFDWCQASLEKIKSQTHLSPPQRLRLARQRIERADQKFDQLVGVEVLDDRTLRVTLERRIPYFLEVAATWPLFPLHRETLRAHMRVDPHTLRLRRDPQWTKPDTIVSNGPYRLAAWEFKRRLRLQANPHYWNADMVGPETVELTNFQDANTMFIAYEARQLDVMFGAGPLPFSPDLVRAQREGRRDDVHGFTTYGTYYYVFNCRPTLPDGTPNPFADPRIRRAFAMTINKPPLVEQVTRLHQEVTDVFIPRGAIDGYPSPQGLGYDPERARQLLGEAGHPNGRGLPPVLLIYNTGGGHEKVAQAVARMWERQLGVSVNLEGQEWKVFLGRRNEGGFHIARSGWFGDYMDPTTFLNLFETGNGNNDAGFSDPHYDALLRKAAAEPDPAKRLAILHDAEAYIMNEALPAVPLYYYKLIHLYDDRKVSGVSLHPRNLQFFHRMNVAEGTERPGARAREVKRKFQTGGLIIER